MIAGKPALFLTGLALIALLVGSCNLGKSEQPTRLPPTLSLLPRPSPIPPTPTTGARLPLPAVGLPEWRPASQGIPCQVGVAAVAVAPSDPRILYLAAYEPGGLYRSDDGGDTWRATQRGLEHFAPMALAVHPTAPDVAAVGTAAGVYNTADGGESWQPAGDFPRMPVYALAYSPDGVDLYAGGEDPGVWWSGDGGQSWSASVLANTESSVLSLAVTGDGTVLAGTAGQGVWVRPDRGGTWEPLGEELPSPYVTLVQPLDDGRMYALAGGHLTLSQAGHKAWEVIGPRGF